MNQSNHKHICFGNLYRGARKLWLIGCTILGIGLSVIGSIALSACNAPPIETLTPTAVDPTRAVIEDDFSSPNPNWVRFDTDEGAAYVLDHEFYLEDRGKGIAVHSPMLGQTWSNLFIEVQVRQVQGSMNNWMGILCRQHDEENYYLFAISADGYYLILKMEEGSPIPLIEPTAAQSIRVGKATNYLKVHLHQDDLAFSVNNTLLVTRTDQAFDKGSVALFADAVEVGQTTVVAFDNFTLTPLDAED